MARKVGKRQLRRPIITIIGEGRTEWWYMLHLRSLCGLSYDMKSQFFSVTSPKDMRKKIDEVLKEQGFAVCVFDMDVFENNSTSLLEYQSMISDYSNNDVLFCETMPSIEYWFLLHYVNKNGYLRTCSDAIKEFKKYMKSYRRREDFLENEQWVKDLISDGKLQNAISRARLFGRQSNCCFSNMYKVFELFKRKA